jgi:hypothetical protein
MLQPLSRPRSPTLLAPLPLKRLGWRPLAAPGHLGATWTNVGACLPVIQAFRLGLPHPKSPPTALGRRADSGRRPVEATPADE